MIPNVLTVLSMPDGFPWINFSPSNAHLFTSSRSLLHNFSHPPCELSIIMASDKASRAAASETHNDADEPMPEPSGRSEKTTTFPGL